MDEQPVAIPRLIAGMSRAGTTWLNRLLNEHPDVAAFGETSFWGRAYVQPARNGSYDQRQLERQVGTLMEHLVGPPDTEPGGLKRINRRTLGPIVQEAFAAARAPMTPPQFFQRYCNAIARAEGKRVWIEKTPHHINWVDRIFHWMPQARIIAMVREPYGFMLSYKHQGDHREPRIRRLMHHLYHPAGCAVVWRGFMRSTMYAVQKHPQQIMRVCLDETDRPLSQTIIEVQKFLLLDPVDNLCDRVPPSNTSFHGTDRPVLGSDDLFWMNLIAGRTIQRGGFQRRAAAWCSLQILISFVKLPFWGLYILLRFHRVAGRRALGYLWHWLLPRRGGAGT